MNTTLPIILAHGICPFDKVFHPFSAGDNVQDDRFHYFRTIRTTLINHGFLAFHTRVNWAGGLKRRSSDLRREIIKITENFSLWPAVHIFAHSMGGLDARMMIHRYRMERRVLSLTTIGTPHHGTSYADRGIKKFSSLIRAARRLGINIEGFRELTRGYCRTLNSDLEAFERDCGVLFRTVAGVKTLEGIFMPLRYSYRIVWEAEGENDGLVPFESALWKKAYFLEKLEADHINLIGWWHRGDAAVGVDRETFENHIGQFYLRLAGSLRD